MRSSHEVERTQEVKDYDRSRRWVILAVALVVAVIGGVAMYMQGKAHQYFVQIEGPVHDAYFWGFITPLVALGLVIGLFLIVWYTPVMRPIRRRSLRSRLARLERKGVRDRQKPTDQGPF